MHALIEGDMIIPSDSWYRIFHWKQILLKLHSLQLHLFDTFPFHLLCMKDQGFHCFGGKWNKLDVWIQSTGHSPWNILLKFHDDRNIVFIIKKKKIFLWHNLLLVCKWETECASFFSCFLYLICWFDWSAVIQWCVQSRHHYETAQCIINHIVVSAFIWLLDISFHKGDDRNRSSDSEIWTTNWWVVMFTHSKPTWNKTAP